MAQKGPIVQINSSAIPVAGIGGIGLLGVAIVIGGLAAEARLILFGGLAGGVALAWFSIVRRRRATRSHPSGDSNRDFSPNPGRHRRPTHTPEKGPLDGESRLVGSALSHTAGASR